MRKRRKLFIFVAMIMIAFLCTVGKTYAFYSSGDSVDNLFKTGQVSHVIVEDFPDGQNISGENGTIKKEVKLRNTSDVDTFMRVAIIPMWVDEDGKPWAGDTSNIKINYAEGYIADMRTYTAESSEQWFANDGTDKDNYHRWVEDKKSVGNIHYFYYTYILKNDSTTNPIINSVNYVIPADQAKRYEGKKLIIKVKSEIVVANKDALDNAWSDLKDDKIKDMLLKLPTDN